MAIAKARSRREKEIDAEITHSLFDDLTKFEMFFADHLKMLVVLGLAIVCAAGVTVAVLSHYRAGQRKAESALSAASTEAELTAALAQYGSHPAARHARLRLARMLTASGQYEKAGEQFAELAKSGLPPELLNRALIDSACLMEDAGKSAEAAAKLAAVGHDETCPAALRAEALYGAGRIQLANGDAAKAAEELKLAVSLKPQLADDPVGQEWVRLAEFLLHTRIK